jgi:hypothetical protein
MGLIGIISDVHSNYNALKKVVTELRKLDVDEIYGLGDIVSFNPQEPKKSLIFAHNNSIRSVMGNHDMDLISAIENPDLTSDSLIKILFGEYAKKGSGRSANELRKILKGMDYGIQLDKLRKMPGCIINPIQKLIFYHHFPEVEGTLFHFEDEYTREGQKFLKSHFANMEFGEVNFFGHSHEIGFFSQERSGTQKAASNGNVVFQREYELSDSKTIVNPGSVGLQTYSDLDRHLSTFATFDTEKRILMFHKVHVEDWE